MKNGLLIFFGFFCFTRCFAQGTADTIELKNRLSDSVIEKFYVIKSNHEIKTGPYMALLHRRIPIAKGNYKNGKKTGTWQFFNSAGRLDQRYNYDQKRLTYLAPFDNSGDIGILFDDSLKIGDRLTRPLRIGGVFYGYLPYLDLFHLPFDMNDADMETFDAEVELLISPMGRLADYKVHVVSAVYQYNQIFNLDVKLFSDEDRTFIPATRNGEAVISRIVIKCYVTPYGTIDFY